MRVGLIVKTLEGLFSRENPTECSQIYDILSRFPYQNFLLYLLCSISELRDYSGCILFDEYQVGLLVRDLTKIIALRPGEEHSCSTVSNTPMYAGQLCGTMSYVVNIFFFCRPSRSSTPISQVHNNHNTVLTLII